MFKSINDFDYYLWEVIDLAFHEPIRGVQWANDITGELERIKLDIQGHPILVYSTDCPLECKPMVIREKRDILFRRKKNIL